MGGDCGVVRGAHPRSITTGMHSTVLSLSAASSASAATAHVNSCYSSPSPAAEAKNAKWPGNFFSAPALATATGHHLKAILRRTGATLRMDEGPEHPSADLALGRDRAVR